MTGQFRDREEVHAAAGLLRGSGLYIAEDVTRQTREKKSELRNFLREAKVRDPGIRYHLGRFPVTHSNKPTTILL